MDEKEIINLAKQEDKAAFEKLVITYKPALEKFAYQFGIDTEAISDVVQETFIKVYEKLYRFESGNFQVWLYKIAVGVNRDFYRKKRVVEKKHSGAYYFESDTNLFLHQAIQALDERYRLPLILFYFHDQTHEEIASILRAKSSTIKSRMAKGREKLESTEADLDGILPGLKENYHLLPEYANTNKIMSELPKKKQKKRRWHLIPLATIIAGFFLFFMLALPQIEEGQQGNDPVDEVEEPEEESVDELAEFAKKKQEEFQRALGVHSLDGFMELDHVEYMLMDRDTYYYNDEDLMTMIDEVYITPQQLIDELEQAEGEARKSKWFILLQRFVNLEWSLSENLKIFLNDFPLDDKEQAALVENQYNYNGPIEIVEFLSALHKQGYKLEQNEDFLLVSADYNYLTDEIDFLEEEEGLLAYFTFLGEKMHVNYYGHSLNMNDIPWQELDDVLLEMEAIYRDYPEYREIYSYYTGGIYATSGYLNAYITGGFNNENDEAREEIMLELQHFTENHPDSIFEPVISQVIEQYETEDPEDYHFAIAHDTEFLFNNMESKLSYDGLHTFNQWPIRTKTQWSFTKYENMKDEAILNEMSPIELLSIYTYAADWNQELYELLYIGDSVQDKINWSSLVDESSIIMENIIDDYTIEFSFVNTYYREFSNTIVATVTLQHDGEGWKVVSQEKINIYT